MGFSKITYNGYTFPPQSDFSCTEEFVYDDAGVTVVRTKFKLHVHAYITKEPAANFDTNEAANFCGPDVFHALQLLSKAGEELLIEHDGFSDRPFIRVGGSQANLVRDSSMGPKPRFLEQPKFFHTTCAEINWECEFEIPVCDGTAPPRFRGVSAFNYTITFDQDEAFRTTRRVSGYLEIMSSRNGRSFTDTVEDYRHLVNIGKPDNFKRTSSTWVVSADRRRAEFTIVDAEIASPNVFPAGVVNIESDHDAEWSARRPGHIGNTISCMIELAADQPRWRAWDIFRTIIMIRRSYAQSLGLYVLLDSIRVKEQLFGMKISFSASYRIAGKIGYDAIAIPASGILFSATGLLQPLEIVDQYNPSAVTWKRWRDSVKHLVPFEGGPTDRGLAGLKHDLYKDHIVDPCDLEGPRSTTDQTAVRPSQGYQIASLCNPTPPPEYSWTQYQGQLKYEEHATESVSVTLGPNDLQGLDFNPRSPDALLPRNVGSDIKRYFESYAGVTEFVFSGMAERVGYPIPVPGNLKIGGRLLVPVKNGGTYETRPVGELFCVPVYQAVWQQRYRFYENPEKIDPNDAVPT